MRGNAISDGCRNALSCAVIVLFTVCGACHARRQDVTIPVNAGGRMINGRVLTGAAVLLILMSCISCASAAVSPNPGTLSLYERNGGRV